MADNPIKVLLVEDNPGDARLLGSMLEAAGAAPFLVTNAIRLEQAMEFLANETFDAVVLDLGLPDSSGIGTVDRTHMPAVNSRVPIVVVTGAVDGEEAVEAARHGAHDFLLKNDLRAENLVRTIRFAIERQRLRNRTEDEDAKRRHENETHSLESISAGGTSLVTARAHGTERLRESTPDTFDLLVDQYVELIGGAAERHAFRVDGKTSQGLRVLAQRLGFLRARPRDVVDIHTTAVKKAMECKQFRRACVLDDESRLLPIEVMGYLAAYYRDRMIPAGSPRAVARRRVEWNRTGE